MKITSDSDHIMFLGRLVLTSIMLSATLAASQSDTQRRRDGAREQLEYQQYAERQAKLSQIKKMNLASLQTIAESGDDDAEIELAKRLETGTGEASTNKDSLCEVVSEGR